MKPETKALLIKLLKQHDGDDVERASAAFRGLTSEQMNREHGQSGKTCQEILDGYLKRREEVKAIIAELENA